MAEASASTILLIAAPSERRDRVVASLGRFDDVIIVDDMSAALEEINFSKPILAIIDGMLSDDLIAWILSALGDPDRALLWISGLRPNLYECGAVVQIPYEVGEATLVSVAERLIANQRLKFENERQRGRVERFDHVMHTVSEVRHALSGPITSLLAEAELLLMDGHKLNEEQRRGVKTMQLMSQRIRDLLKRLQDLDLGKR